MAEELIPIIIVPALFYCIAYISRVISDNRIRREFLQNNASSEIIQKLFIDNRDADTSGNLKWGLVSVAIGLALAVIQVTNLRDHDPLTYGLIFIFGGGGLLLSYVIAEKKEEA